MTYVVSAAILAQQRCQFLCASEKLDSLGILIAKNERGGCRRPLGARLGQAAVVCRLCACLTTLEGDLLAVTIIFNLYVLSCVGCFCAGCTGAHTCSRQANVSFQQKKATCSGCHDLDDQKTCLLQHVVGR